jgi:hypothetical protein
MAEWQGRDRITKHRPPSQLQTSQTLHTNRPGWHYSKYQDDDPTLLSNYGDSIYHKQDRSTRIFQNVKGLTYSVSGEDYEYYLHNLKAVQVDIAD